MRGQARGEQGEDEGAEGVGGVCEGGVEGAVGE